jgi:tripartite-type tricarboxylate transporter receptor subunit TctC
MLRLALSLLACVLTLVPPAKSQEFTRPVRIVMGFGAGGLADISGRAIAEAMSKSIGQTNRDFRLRAIRSKG